MNEKAKFQLSEKILLNTIFAILLIISILSAVNGRYTRHDAARFLYKILQFHGIFAGDPSRLLAHFLFEFPASFLSQFYLPFKVLSVVYGLTLGFVPLLILSIAIKIEKSSIFKMLYLCSWTLTQVFIMTMPVSETNLAFPYFLMLVSFFRSFVTDSDDRRYSLFIFLLIGSGFIHQTFVFFHFYLGILFFQQFKLRKLDKKVFLVLAAIVTILILNEFLTAFFYEFGSVDSYRLDGIWFFKGSNFIMSIILALMLCPLLVIKTKEAFIGTVIASFLMLIFYLDGHYELKETVYFGSSARILNLIIPSILFIFLWKDSKSELTCPKNSLTNFRVYTLFIAACFLAVNRVETIKWNNYQSKLMELLQNNPQITYLMADELTRTDLQYPQYNFIVNQVLLTNRVTTFVSAPLRVEAYVQIDCSELAFLKRYKVVVLDCPAIIPALY